MEKILITILLADDDKEDRYFFARALKKIPIPTQLITLEDGEALLDYLAKNADNLPDILFLDINMPRKNGLEALKEINGNKKIKPFPIIIYSTSLDEDVADVFYNFGAYYYVQKSDFNELVRKLEFILNIFEGKNFKRPAREKFIFNLQEA